MICPTRHGFKDAMLPSNYEYQLL